jgi:hypothetical protein
MAACQAVFPNCEIAEGSYGVAGWVDTTCMGCNCDPPSDWQFFCFGTTADDPWDCGVCQTGYVRAAHYLDCSCGDNTVYLGTWCTP